MKLFKSLSIIVLTILCVSCGGSSISEDTMLQIDTLLAQKDSWTPEQINKAKNILLDCYRQVTPEMEAIARKSTDMKQFEQNGGEALDQKYQPVQNLYQAFIESNYTQLQLDEVMRARNEMLDAIRKSFKK